MNRERLYKLADDALETGTLADNRDLCLEVIRETARVGPAVTAREKTLRLSAISRRLDAKDGAAMRFAMETETSDHMREVWSSAMLSCIHPYLALGGNLCAFDAASKGYTSFGAPPPLHRVIPGAPRLRDAMRSDWLRTYSELVLAWVDDRQTLHASVRRASPAPLWTPRQALIFERQHGEGEPGFITDECVAPFEPARSYMVLPLDMQRTLAVCLIFMRYPDLRREQRNFRHVAACVTYLQRRATREAPEGTSDTRRRWYPSEAEKRGCCQKIKRPSKKRPHHLRQHCYSMCHCGALFRTLTTPTRARVNTIAQWAGTLAWSDEEFDIIEACAQADRDRLRMRRGAPIGPEASHG